MRAESHAARLWFAAALPMLGALVGGWLDERSHLGFTLWRSACRSAGLRLASLVDFTVQLLPGALTGLLLGGLAVLACGALWRRGAHAGLCIAAHAGCVLSLPLTLVLCTSALPLAGMLLLDTALAALIGALLLRLVRTASRPATAHP